MGLRESEIARLVRASEKRRLSRREGPSPATIDRLPRAISEKHLAADAPSARACPCGHRSRRPSRAPRQRRKEVPELPMPAVSEAIVNGLTHADYRSGEAMQVDIFADSVETYNAGWFPDGQTPEAHLSGEDKRSKSRNQLIASSLFKSQGHRVVRNRGAPNQTTLRRQGHRGRVPEDAAAHASSSTGKTRSSTPKWPKLAEGHHHRARRHEQEDARGQLRLLHLGGHGRLSEVGIASRGAYPRARRRVGARGERGPDVQDRPAALGGQT